jgi:UDP-N-acetylmuramoylalanine--D-glutamate ligase
VFRDIIKSALAQTKKGDIILFSPAFASFGMFKNEFDRGDKFTKIIKSLK